MSHAIGHCRVPTFGADRHARDNAACAHVGHAAPYHAASPTGDDHARLALRNPVGVDALTWKELPTPAPKAGEVLIAIKPPA